MTPILWPPSIFFSCPFQMERDLQNCLAANSPINVGSLSIRFLGDDQSSSSSSTSRWVQPPKDK